MKFKFALIVALFVFGLGCSEDTVGGADNNRANNANNANNGNNSNNGTNGSNNLTPWGTDLPFEVNAEGQVLCGDTPCACSDGIDNDGDGLADGFDVECTGPYDNDEGSFATGIPGDNKDPKWQDCFFDGNSGSGNDGCRYRTECLTGELPQSDPDCQLSERCIQFCARFAPNGCDCFGCCEIFTAPDTSVKVVIGTSCSVDNIDDEDACPRCVQSEQCLNECGECELCGGRTVEDLPESCSMGGGDPDMGGGDPDMGGGSDMGGGGGDNPGFTCDDGAQVCTPTSPCAAANQYCAQGCCIDAPL